MSFMTSSVEGRPCHGPVRRGRPCARPRMVDRQSPGGGSPHWEHVTVPAAGWVLAHRGPPRPLNDDRARRRARSWPHPLRHVAFLAALLAVALLSSARSARPCSAGAPSWRPTCPRWAPPGGRTESPAEANTGDHGPITDTVDASYPTRVAVAEAARDGDLFGWNPFTRGGTAAGRESASRRRSARSACSTCAPRPGTRRRRSSCSRWRWPSAFTYLFCRRIGVGRVPAVFAGPRSPASAFLVMWTNWQQPEVAALIARAVLGDRALPAAPVGDAGRARRRRPRRDAARQLPRRGRLRPVRPGRLRRRAPGGGRRPSRCASASPRRGRRRPASLAGVLLVAAVLLPFARPSGRPRPERPGQQAGDNLGSPRSSPTVAPKALGPLDRGGRGCFGARNQVEGVSFVGVTTALARRRRPVPAPAPAAPPGTRLALGTVALVLGRVLRRRAAAVAAAAAPGVQRQLHRPDAVGPGVHRGRAGRPRAPGAGRATAGPTGRARRPAGAVLVAARGGRAPRSPPRARDLAVRRRPQVTSSGRSPPGRLGVAAACSSRRRDPARPPRAAGSPWWGWSGLLVVESLRLVPPAAAQRGPRSCCSRDPRDRLPGREPWATTRVAPEGFTLFGSADDPLRHPIRRPATPSTPRRGRRPSKAADPTCSPARRPCSLLGRPDGHHVGRCSTASACAGSRPAPQHVPLGPEEDHGLAAASVRPTRGARLGRRR